MQLPPDQVERFFNVWKPLLLFVNRRLRLVPKMLAKNFKGPWVPATIVKIREALWADDSLREAFIVENPAKLTAPDLALVDSWKHRVPGPFFVYKHLKKYSLLIKDQSVYGVLGLGSSLAELAPYLPAYINTVLLPFEDHIIYDSLVEGYNVAFGPGYRADLKAIHDDARERNAIITTLPPGQTASPAAQQKSTHATDAKVLDAFRARLFAGGFSTNVVGRDLANVDAFAEFLLHRDPPRSLREFGIPEVQEYLAQVNTAAARPTHQRSVRTSLKRFLKFLRDTLRLDYDTAQEVLGTLKEEK